MTDPTTAPGTVPATSVVTPPATEHVGAVMTLRDVSVAFSGKVAVRDVSFDVPINQVTALIGPSGSGKTTLLRSLNRMHDMTRGAVVIGLGQAGQPRRLRVHHAARRCSGRGSGWSSSARTRSPP